MKMIIALFSIAFLSTVAFAATPAEMEAKINKLEAKIAKFEKLEARLVAMEKLEAKLSKTQEAKIAKTAKVQTKSDAFKKLEKKVAKIEKDTKRTKKTLAKVKAHDAFDNIKFGLDFRNAIDVLGYKNNKTGEEVNNGSLLSSRLYLNMKSSPMNGLIFSGKLAIYSTWGSSLYTSSTDPLKDWSASSKPSDTVMRVKEAYFVYSWDMGEQPLKLSIGRRPASTGFLANYRENEPDEGSPLAHITNMEVNAIMFQLDLSRYIEGAYTKVVYGRAHTGETNNVYSTGSNNWGPYADIDSVDENENVDFFLFLGDVFNNGQYQLMYQWAHIFNTKGKALNGAGTADDVNKADSGFADLGALSLKVDGIGDEISDFLDETIVFASVAATSYDAKSGHTLNGSSDGGSKLGHSFWIGAVFPDMMTERGKLGFEYNHGSQYWTPMTWAEDSAMGSKIAVRGDAYEAYWNFDLFGVKNLPSQIRYTYAQHDYTPNANCAGWVTPVAADLTAQDLRVSVSYRY